MGIKHQDKKASKEIAYASEWNKDHVIDGDVDFKSHKITNLANGTSNQDAVALSQLNNYVPYTGANKNINLGTNNLETTGNLSSRSITTGIIKPASDSTTALSFNKADGTTNILTIDSTNKRIGIGTTSPGAKLDVAGLIRASGNYYNVISWNYNNVLTNGVKIKTNIPYTDGSQMPTIIIEGYDYGNGNPIGISLVWYIYNGSFTSYKASSWGNKAPTIKIANENGYVTIWLDWRPYFGRMTVRAYAQGISETPSWFNGWTVADEVAGTANQVTVPYANTFPGTVNLAGGVWNSNGSVGIGTTSPSYKLDVVDTSANVAKFTRTSEGSVKIGAGSGISWVEGRNATDTNYQTIGLKTASTPGLILDTSGNVGIGTTSPSTYLDVNGNKIRIESSKTPASATATGSAGDICWDSSYIYVCVATNTWKRASLSSW